MFDFLKLLFIDCQGTSHRVERRCLQLLHAQTNRTIRLFNGKCGPLRWNISMVGEVKVGTEWCHWHVTIFWNQLLLFQLFHQLDFSSSRNTILVGFLLKFLAGPLARTSQRQWIFNDVKLSTGYQNGRSKKHKKEPLLFQVFCIVRRKMALVHVQGKLNMHSWLHGCTVALLFLHVQTTRHIFSHATKCSSAMYLRGLLPCSSCHRTNIVLNCQSPRSPIIPAPTTESAQHLSHQNWQFFQKLPQAYHADRTPCCMTNAGRPQWYALAK